VGLPAGTAFQASARAATPTTRVKMKMERYPKRSTIKPPSCASNPPRVNQQSQDRLPLRALPMLQPWRCSISAFNRNMVILLMPVFGIVMAASLTPIAALAAVGIGGSLGFAWAGTIVAQGTKAGFQSALWICVAIGVAALATSMILKPRPLVTAPDSTPQVTH